MGIDREWTIDATERAKDTSSFSAVHMNHSSTRQNVGRRCSRAERRVSFYAANDIQVSISLACVGTCSMSYWSHGVFGYKG